MLESLNDGLPDLEVYRDLVPGELNLDPKGDRGLAVRFYEYAPTQTAHMEVRFPGDKLTVIDRPASEIDKRRFPAQWQAFEGGGEYEGQTRLETCAWADPGLVKEMAYEGILTVEQLAGLPDEVVRRNSLLGLIRLRELAQEHLVKAQRTADAESIRANNAVLQSQVDKLQEQVAQLVAARQGQPDVPVKRGPGRPPKTAQA